MKYAKKTLDFTLETITTKDASNECIIEGYANTSSKDRVGDVVIPSAFEKSLKTYMNNPVLLVNHDWADVAGVVQESKITDKGLYVRAKISNTREDLKTLIREGCLRTFSIGYNEVDADIDESTKTKYIKELELLEISVVSVPANTEAMFTLGQTKVEPALTEEQQKDNEKALKDFILTVKNVVGTDLGDDLIINVIDYFNISKGKQVMTKEELINKLKAKSLEAASPAKKDDAAQAAPAAAADMGKPGDANMGDAMKALMEKIDMIGQAVGQCLEALNKMQQEEDMEAADEQQEPAASTADEAKKAEEDKKKKEEEAMAQEQAAKNAQTAVTTEEKSAELSVEEVDAELALISAQIQELDDSENN